MTRKEKQKAIDALKISAPVMAVTQEEFNDYIQTLNKVMDWLEQESINDTISKLLDETFDDFCNCPGGEGYFYIDGETYNTDAGYALEGMEIFIKVFKKRLTESEDKE